MKDLVITPKPDSNIMQRSLLVFENAIKSEATKKQYLYQLEKFRTWAGIKDCDSLLEAPDKQIQILLEDYLFYLKKKLSPNTIPPVFAALELFFAMNDKVIDSKKLRKMFPAKIKKSGYTAYSNEDAQKMLRNTSKKRSRAILLLLASTGCRIGAMPDLKIKNVSKMPDDCKSVLFYEGSNEEYYGFLTPEAAKALDEYVEERKKDGEKLTLDSPLFRAKYRLGIEKVKPMNSDTMQQVIHAIVKPNVNRDKIGRRYNIQAAHGLRKRFATIVKMDNRISYSISERLLGHQAYLDKEYMRPTKEALFKEFQKVITELTVSDSERLQIQSKIKDEKISKLESEKDKKISDLEDTTRQLSERLQKQESMTAEISKIHLKTKETMNRESDPSNLHYPDGGPFDTRLVNLEMKEINDKSMIIFDTEFEERIEVVLRKGKVYCTLDKSSTCKHVLFAIGNFDFYQLVKKHGFL